MLVPLGLFIDHGHTVLVLFTFKEVEQQLVLFLLGCFAFHNVVFCDLKKAVHRRTEDLASLAIAGVHVERGGAGTQNDAVTRQRNLGR